MILFYDTTSFNVSQFIRKSSNSERGAQEEEEHSFNYNSALYSSGLLKLTQDNPPVRASKIRDSEIMRQVPVSEAQRFYAQDDYQLRKTATTNS